MSGHCGVNACMKQWKFLSTDCCPRCGEKEHADHVWFYQSQSAKTRFTTELDKLRKWLINQHTHRDSLYLIMTALDQLHSTIPVSFDKSFSNPAVNQIIDSQNQIGWKGLTQGLLATEWASTQQSHYDFLNSRQTGHTFSSTGFIAFIKECGKTKMRSIIRWTMLLS